jgi:hypothetical protein
MLMIQNKNATPSPGIHVLIQPLPKKQPESGSSAPRYHGLAQMLKMASSFIRLVAPGRVGQRDLAGTAIWPRERSRSRQSCHNPPKSIRFPMQPYPSANGRRPGLLTARGSQPKSFGPMAQSGRGYGSILGRTRLGRYQLWCDRRLPLAGGPTFLLGGLSPGASALFFPGWWVRDAGSREMNNPKVGSHTASGRVAPDGFEVVMLFRVFGLFYGPRISFSLQSYHARPMQLASLRVCHNWAKRILRAEPGEESVQFSRHPQTAHRVS